MPPEHSPYGVEMELISQEAPPLPGRVVLTQFWADLTFLHWRVDAALVASLLPAGIVPDVFDGSAWVGLIPFRMLDTALAGTPKVPYFGSFTEVNVRLYGVDASGNRGVVFTSLEASRLAAVLVARASFGLPYFWANARTQRTGDVIRYESRRLDAGHASTRIVSRTSTIPVVQDPLADHLTARWRLFVQRGNRTFVQANRHAPWPLFQAELLELDDGLLAASGFSGLALREPDSVLYSPGVAVAFSGPQRVLHTA